jgi:hypothetical protein
MNYIRNPKTHRIVKVDGILAKKIIKEHNLKGEEIIFFRDKFGKEMYTPKDTNKQKVKDYTDKTKLKDVKDYTDKTKLKDVKDYTDKQKVKDYTDKQKVKDYTNKQKVKDYTDKTKLKDVKKRCPKGFHKNKKTGECQEKLNKNKNFLQKKQKDILKKEIDKRLLDVSLWKKEKVDKKIKGGNPAMFYISPNGTKYYGKIGKNYERLETELLASKLYNLSGVLSANLELAKDEKNYILLSKWFDDLSDKGSKQAKDKIKDNYVIDSWLANWDIYKSGNILFTKEHEPLRLDVGGSLDYRALGKKKGTNTTQPFGPEVKQLQTLKKYNTLSYLDITNDEIKNQARELQKIPNIEIKKVVFDNIIDKNRANELYNILIQRKNYIINIL